MFRRFAKRESVFVKLIREQASLTLEGLEALKAYLVSQDPGSLRPAEYQGEGGRRGPPHLDRRAQQDLRHAI